jgi:hypothetical protein
VTTVVVTRSTDTVARSINAVVRGTMWCLILVLELFRKAGLYKKSIKPKAPIKGAFGALIKKEW